MSTPSQSAVRRAIAEKCKQMTHTDTEGELTGLIRTTILIKLDSIALHVGRHRIGLITQLSALFHEMCDHSRDGRGVNSAAEVDSHWHVCFQADLYSL